MTAPAAAGWAGTATAWLWAMRLRRLLRRHREAAARAAHELRGPLTAIGLALEAELGRARVGGDGSRAVEVALAPGRGGWDRWRAVEIELARANLALDDLAALRWGARLTPAAGAERVDVATVLHESVCAAAARAAAAGVQLLGQWRGAPAVVRGDRRRLGQAIGNLIANAIEHGGGVVEVLGQAGPDAVRIEVRDCGPGLPAPVAELVRSARDGRGERGRGLAIASAIALQHRGRLAAAPAPRGARLVLELPTAAGGFGPS